MTLTIQSQRTGVCFNKSIAHNFQAVVPLSSTLLLATLLEESTLGVEQLLAPSGHVSDRFLDEGKRQVSRSARQSSFEASAA